MMRLIQPGAVADARDVTQRSTSSQRGAACPGSVKEIATISQDVFPNLKAECVE
jgi:hypothetical protein